MTTFLLIAVLAFSAGVAVGYILSLRRASRSEGDLRTLMAEMEARKAADVAALSTQMKDAFNSLSLQALSQSNEAFLTLAKESLATQTTAHSQELGGKKELIDQTLVSMKGELEKVQTLVQSIEKDRQAKFDVLSVEITKAANETQALRDTANSLRAALTNSRVRGQWGERMAEDVLKLAGFVEGINYHKQGYLSSEDAAVSRPDFTFYMPRDRVVHMDVKFPLENYLMYTDAQTEADKQRYTDAFLKDARRAIEDVTKRNYVNTTQNTLDYVLVFIPNEQVYAFLHEHDRALLDQSLRKKIILCSPTTLYAVLAVIRQAMENFHLERTTAEILNLLGAFNKQWGEFAGALDKVSKTFDSTHTAFQTLLTTRKRALERPLRQIEALRSHAGAPADVSALPLEDGGDDVQIPPSRLGLAEVPGVLAD